MDIQALGAIGEFVSSLVIVVTLVFLTLETRRAKHVAIQANRVANQNIRHDLARQIVESSTLAQALITADHHLTGTRFYEERAAEYGLTPLEFQQLATYMRSRITHWHDQYYTDLPDQDRIELDNQIRFLALSSVYKKFWTDVKATRPMGKEFMEHVDRLSSS